MKTWRKLEQLVDAGLVRHIGTSNMTIPKLRLLLRDARIKPVCNEMELHPHFQQPELFQFVIDNGMIPIGFSLSVLRRVRIAIGPRAIRSTLRIRSSLKSPIAWEFTPPSFVSSGLCSGDRYQSRSQSIDETTLAICVVSSRIR